MSAQVAGTAAAAVGEAVQVGKVDQSPNAAGDDYVFLIGRPPITDYLGFVTGQAVNGHLVDVRALVDEWRTANDHVQRLQREEAGIANAHAVGPLDPRLSPLEQELLHDEAVIQSFKVLPSRIGMVELDRLVVFQKQINLQFVEEIKKRLGNEPDAEAIFRMAMSMDQPSPGVRLGQVAPNSFGFSSSSNDLRFLGARLLGPAQVTGLEIAGRAAAVVAIAVGFGSNCLNAWEMGGRLVLGNGSHRAFALRDLGVKYVPCIVQSLSRPEELRLVAPPDVHASHELYFTAERPPVLRDYFDPLLRSIVSVARRKHEVRVQFGFEQPSMLAD
jgi:hypothetical protein